MERNTGKSQITLVWNNNNNTNDDSSKLQKFTETIIRMGSNSSNNSSSKKKRKTAMDSFSLHSLWMHRNTAWKHSNAIFDITAPLSTDPNDENASWKLIHGPDTIKECIIPSSNISNKSFHPPYEVNLHFPPNVFRQANVDAFAKIVQRIRDRIIAYNQSFTKENNKLPSILELYGGVGTIGLHLADLTSSITCSDENVYNPKSFQSAVSSCLPPDIAQRCTYMPKNAADMVSFESGSYLNKADIIVVDPPRKGLDDVVVDALISKSTASQTNTTSTTISKLLVYVSCGFDAFQRNCKRLEEEGRWVLEHAEGHLLFPGSDAIETLAFFTC